MQNRQARRHWADPHIDEYEGNTAVRDHLLGTHAEETADWNADVGEMDLESLNDQHAALHGAFD